MILGAIPPGLRFLPSLGVYSLDPRGIFNHASSPPSVVRGASGDRCVHREGRTRSDNVKRKSSAVPISPGSKLGPAGKQRPPKVEKLKGDESPPSEQELKRKAR